MDHAGHGVIGVTCDKNIKSVPYGHVYRKRSLRSAVDFCFAKMSLRSGWGRKEYAEMSSLNNHRVEFTAKAIAANDPEHLLNWQQRWPNFSPGELASKGDGSLVVNYKALDALQQLRTMWRRPMIIGSAYRDPAHNERVGGAKASLHMQGRAFDVRMEGYSDAAVVSFLFYAIKAGFNGFGLYLDRPTPFIHIDTGSHRTWQSGQSRLDDTDDVTEITPQFR